MTTDDFVTRLREAALASVPPSTLDVDTVLRSSRRKAALWRAGTGAGLCLAVAAGGVGVAHALPLVPGLLDATTPAEVAPAAIGLADLSGHVGDRSTIEAQESVPGVSMLTSPGTKVVDDDTLVLDLGFRAGAGGDRYYFVRMTVGESPSGALYPAQAELLVGDRRDLEILQSGGEAGDFVADALRTFQVVEDAETGQRLVFGMQPAFGADVADTSRHGWLVFRDPVLTYSGAWVQSIEVPTVNVLGNDRVFFYAAAFGASLHAPQEPGGAMPGLTAFDSLRGYLGYDAADGMFASCWSTTNLGQGPCTTVLNPRTGSVATVVEMPENPVEPDIEAAIVSELLGGQYTGAAASARAFVACMAARGEAFQIAEVERTWLGDPHPRADAGTWRRCAADVVDAGATSGLAVLRPAALAALAGAGDSGLGW